MASAERGPLAVILCLVLAACGQMAPQVAVPTPAAADQASGGSAPASAETVGAWDKSLDALRLQDQRVSSVAYRIVTANLALCSDVAPQSGLILQSTLQYRPQLRPVVEARFHVDDRPAVEAIAAGSPAAAAGLQLDDILIAVDDEPLPRQSPAPSAGADDRPQTLAPVELAETRLSAAMGKGPAAITVQRGAQQLRLVLSPKPGCAYDAQVLPGPALNASADGRHVFVCSAFVSYAASDDMLALILGHEFAHDVLHHHDRLGQAGIARDVLGDLGSTPQSLKLAEREADYVGLYLTARAGYDISNAPDFWRRFPAAGGGELSWSHPSNAERAAALAETRDEILAKVKADQALIPTPAAGAPPLPLIAENQPDRPRRQPHQTGSGGLCSG